MTSGLLCWYCLLVNVRNQLLLFPKCILKIKNVFSECFRLLKYGSGTAATLEIYFDVLNSSIHEEKPKYEVHIPNPVYSKCLLICLYSLV